MKKAWMVFIIVGTFVALRDCKVISAAEPVTTSAAVKACLEKPPRQYSSSPLWVWNDLLTDDQIVSTLHDLAGQDVKQVFVHPRPGLITPYLSDEWFRLWKLALRTAETLDMNVWIYDENSYPSGFAGGWVPEVMPESIGRGLVLKEAAKPDEIPVAAVAVYRVADDGFQNITKHFRSGETIEPGRFLYAEIVRARPSPWHGGRAYVDLIYPGVTEKFLEITLDAYQREVGKWFGSRVPGSFTDEPRLLTAGELTWTDDLADCFRQECGYDLLDHLPSLLRPIGDWKRVRHDYYRLLLKLFIERWAKPYFEWCEKHGIEFTGHYWEHEWPRCGVVPDNMAMYAWHQRPAIDCLMNQYAEHTHAQFGNIRAVRELASVADQMGRKRTLCELYGAAGWDLRFQDMKRIADWLGVLGVNTFDQHLSYVTIRGARKMDHPQSFSYHEPWWDSYHVIARYLTRLSLVLSAGDRINEILVLEPTSTAWMYQGQTPDPSKLNALGSGFFDFLKLLETAQLEYDLGCEDIMARHGRVADGRLIIGRRAYHTVVLPSQCENLEGPTVKLLEQFLQAGGEVFVCGDGPALVDARPATQLAALRQQAGWKEIEPLGLLPILSQRQDQRIRIIPESDGKGLLFHQRRRLDDGEILILVNTSDSESSQGILESTYRGAEIWDLESGDVKPAAFVRKGELLSLPYELPPVGSLVVFFSEKAIPPGRIDRVAEQLITMSPITAARRQPNVLTLDYVDVQVGDAVRQGIYYYQACDWVFKKHGWAGNPWDRAVQFRDEILRKEFAADSGFRVTYRFQIAEKVPPDLAIVIERPDLYSISCNGQAIKWNGKDWWLDRGFGKIDISRCARVGENEVELKAAPMTVFHEIAPAYVLGDFSLEPAAKGFVIVPPKPLHIKDSLAGHVSSPNHTMWLSSGIGFDRNAADKDDPQPWLIFDFEENVPLAAIQIWNYNEVNLTSRGVKDLEILALEDDATLESGKVLARVTLPQALGRDIASAQSGLPATIVLPDAKVRRVGFRILSNHAGTTFPADQTAADNGFVGLSEVRFLVKEGYGLKAIKRVKVTPSSELKGVFQRVAKNLIDGSGMSFFGWNSQGCPLYGHEVSYTAHFQWKQDNGRCVVRLGSWEGSLAKVIVNGQECSVIYRPPYECDVTACLREGDNTISIVVVGTLKNTLGPHHAGVMRGSAWPHAFAEGPGEGPPPGDHYDTIAYGLFEPFVLVRRSPLVAEDTR
ncbi:MAG: glycosyl hydrolase [Thermogutta sp.]